MDIYKAMEVAEKKLESLSLEQVKRLACLDKLRRKRKLGLVSEMVYSVVDQEEIQVDSEHLEIGILNIKPIDIYKAKSRWFVKEVKKILGCSNCSETHFSCLDFHHINKSDKLFRIAVASNLGYTINKIKSELIKCSLLCSNCHRKEHHPF